MWMWQTIPENEKLISLLHKDKVIIGGETNSKNNQIAPTVMDHVTESDAEQETVTTEVSSDQ